MLCLVQQVAQFLRGRDSGPGPFTVFAPTDEAFARIPQENPNALLLPANKERLTTLLKYHVVPVKLMSSEAANLKTVKTLTGQELKIDGAKGFKINDAKVIDPDIQASNGVVHAIDAVLTPKLPPPRSSTLVIDATSHRQ